MVGTVPISFRYSMFMARGTNTFSTNLSTGTNREEARAVDNVLRLRRKSLRKGEIFRAKAQRSLHLL